jgi:nicotinamide mononucleotide adenylyltransferase
MDLLDEANRLAAELAARLKQSLVEDRSEKRVIVVYSGEFQPFHQGHYEVFQRLQNKFGKDNVYLITGEQDGDDPAEPMSFADKEEVITEMFGISEDKIQQVENPYIPKELLERFEAKTTAFVTVVDEDAAEQLEKSEYFEHYAEDKPLKGYKQAGYFLSEPEVRIKIGNQTLSNSQLIQILGSKHTKDEVKNHVLEKMFPKKNDKVFDMVKKKASLGAKKLDGFEFSDAKGQDNKDTGFKQSDATGQKTEEPEVIGSKNTPIMQRKIRNPITGRTIKIQSALKYPRWKPVYKMANQVLKAAGIDRKDRTDDPEVNQRYHARQKKIKKEDITNELSQQLTEELLQIAKTTGLTLNLADVGEVTLRFESGGVNFLVEGGAAGHLAHPYDDVDLSFNNFGEIVRRGLSGGLDKEAPVTEKLDGQNIQFSYRDGKVIFARNLGHVKNSGKDALDARGVRDKFAGRGNIEDSFGNAADDLDAAIRALPETQRKNMFKGGKKWVNLEIINPETQNVIPYDKNILVFHNTVEYDDEGNEVDRGQEEGAALANMIQKVGAQKQKTYGIQGPQNVAFSDKTDAVFKARQEQYLQDLDEIRGSAGLSSDATLGDYLKKRWSDKLDVELKKNNVKLDAGTKDRLIKRWALGDKSLGARDFKKSNPELYPWFQRMETEAVNFNKQIKKPIEMLFLRVGADSLVRMTNFISANNPEASEALKSAVTDVIRRVQANPDRSPELLTREIERLQGIGFDRVVPTEGVVFIYGGKPYKFTGAFAPVNQLLGALKFGRIATDDVEGSETPSDKTPTGQKKPVVVYPGRFQPFHAGHYSVYKSLVDKYGADNVFIGTSNKTDNEKSPFNFDEKQSIMSSMFGIPKDKIVQVKNPYAPEEILSKFSEDTPFITAFSEKDAQRLANGKYYQQLPDDPSQIRGDYKNVGYYTIAPEFQLDVDGQNISGTTVRKVLGDPKKSDAEKQKLFKAMYGKFDPKVYSLIVGKLSGKTPSTTSPATTKTPAKKSTPSKKATPVTNKRLQAVLNKKVRNPETKRDILVKTALKYDKTHPARKAAMKMIKQSQNK